MSRQCGRLACSLDVTCVRWLVFLRRLYVGTLAFRPACACLHPVWVWVCVRVLCLVGPHLCAECLVCIDLNLLNLH